MSSAEFDDVASQYESQHGASIRLSGGGPAFFAEYKINDIARVLSTRNEHPGRILDFGAGIGNSLPYLRAAFPSSEIVCLDPSAKSLQLAAERYPNAATFQSFDGVSIPYSDGFFDLAFAACVFHHIPAEQHIPLLSEINRVLSAKGSFFLFEHNPFNPLTLHAVRSCPFDEGVILIDAPEISRRMSQANFAITNVSYRIFFPRTFASLRPYEKYLTRLPIGAQYFVHGQKSQ
jgi:ubiquinone/menaquinone biosynthesis C-methylase UbiE